MKNFRKVLALILVVATLFSFAAMTSAKEYKDADKISYDEAVDVLSAIGILNGYDDGTFKPTDSIAREEMAKMIGVLSNAGDDVSDLYASACTFADTKDRWSASYVAYCAQLGIVAGRNASTFDPRGKVTGIETAKMLLCVLGFDASTQGYVGSSWKTNVLRDAKNFGLLDNFASDYDPDKAITREEAAQMMLNALEANIVIGTVSDNLVKISNAIYFDKYGVQISLPDAENEGWIVIYKNVVISWEPLASIYKGLTLLDGQDCYGNPGQLWTYENSKGTVVFQKFYADEADYTYTKAATLTTDLKAEIDSATSNPVRKDYKVLAYVDGTAVDYDIDELGDLADDYTGYGVETKVYVMDDPSMYYCREARADFDEDGVIIVTIKNTYIGKVANVNERKGTFDIVTKTVDGVRDTIAADVEGNADFGFENGDMVLYWVCNGTINARGIDFGQNEFDRESVDAHDFGTVDPKTVVVWTDEAVNENDIRTDIHDVQLVEPAKQYVSYARYVKNDDNYRHSEPYFTADGKNVNYDRNFGHAYDTSIDFMDDAQVKEEWNVYYDLFGYAMYYEVPGDDTEYQYAYFVEDSWEGTPGTTSQSGWSWTYTADYVDFTAKKDNGAINETLKNEMSKAYENPGVVWPGFDRWPMFDKGAGLLAKYHVDEDGTMVWDDTAEILDGSRVTMQLKSGSYVIASATQTDDPLYADNNTKFLVRVPTYGVDGKEYEYIAYTGYKSIDKDYGTEIAFLETYLQYFDENDDHVAEYVFVDATYTSNDDLFYLMGRAHDASWDVLKDYYEDYEVYYALVNGEPAFVAFEKVHGGDDVEDGGDNPTYGDYPAYGLYRGTMSLLNVNVGPVEGTDGQDCPLYVALEYVDEDYTALDGGDVISFTDGGLVQFKKPSGEIVEEYYAAAEDCVLYNVVYENGKYVSCSKDNFNTKDYPMADDGRVWVVFNDAGEVAAIYREVV